MFFFNAIDPIDSNLNRAENFLSSAARYPLIGTVAGLAKVGLGVAQVVAGLSIGIFLALHFDPLWPTKRYFAHVKHGAGNIVAGILESLPIIQTALYYVRENRKPRPPGTDLYVQTNHETKFMPYRSLVAKDITIRGTGDPEKINSALQRFTSFEAAEAYHRRIKVEDISVERHIELAKEAIRQILASS